MNARLHADGRIDVENVTSYRKARQVRVPVGGVGVRGDIAWGGNWFFLTHEQPLDIEPGNVAALSEFAWQLRQAVNAAGFPEVDHVELFAPSPGGAPRARNFVLCPGRAYDRSPCGTGTSAKLACLAAEGELEEGETWTQESLIGSSFSARYRWHARDRGEITPTITGAAHVTGEARLRLDPDDPFCWGIRP